MHRGRRANVYLNVYELLSFDQYNGYLVPIGLGAYHSGVEVYGEEFSFGYHEEDHTGIFTVDPRTAPECRFVESIFVGDTDLSYAQVKRISEDMGVEYRGSSYNIFLKNCNHFTNEFVRRLTNQEAPSYLNRLAALGNAFKCFLPFDSTGQYPEARTPAAMEAVEQGHRLTDDTQVVPLDNDDVEQRRALLSSAAAKRAGVN